jgi:hypothetical protein
MRETGRAVADNRIHRSLPKLTVTLMPVTGAASAAAHTAAHAAAQVDTAQTGVS